MAIDIDQLTEAELIDLNRRIVERLKFLSQMHAHAQRLDFSIGARVSFSASHHGPVTGVIVRYNGKTVTILTEDGLQRGAAAVHPPGGRPHSRPGRGPRVRPVRTSGNGRGANVAAVRNDDPRGAGAVGGSTPASTGGSPAARGVASPRRGGGNGIPDRALLMSGGSDGRVPVQSRSAGAQVPKQHGFAP